MIRKKNIYDIWPYLIIIKNSIIKYHKMMKKTLILANNFSNIY